MATSFGDNRVVLTVDGKRYAVNSIIFDDVEVSELPDKLQPWTHAVITGTLIPSRERWHERLARWIKRRALTADQALWIGRSIIIIAMPAWLIGTASRWWTMVYIAMFAVAFASLLTWVYPMYLGGKGGE